MSKVVVAVLCVFLLINIYPSYVIFTSNPESLWGDLSGLATVNIAFLTAFIVLFGMHQLNATKAQLEESKKVNIRSLSHDSYSKYLQLALEHPNFAYPNPDFIKADQQIFSQYRWYVANMLFYFEEVLVVNDEDKNWSDAISKQIRIHRWYLQSSNYKNQAWSQKLVEIISKEVDRNFYHKKRSIFDQSRKESITCLYEKYLDLLLEEPRFYDTDIDLSQNELDLNKHSLFMKKSLFLLGEIAELAINEKDWDFLVKAEIDVLVSNYEKHHQSGLKNDKVMMKQYQKLLKRLA